MHTSQSAYKCICSELLLTWFYFRHKFTATLWWWVIYYCYCHHHFSPPPSTHRPLTISLNISTLCGLSVTQSTSIFVFPKLFLLPFFTVFPSFCLTHFLTSCCKLITFFLIENFILVLCSKPLELYLHSFLKHAVIIIFSYFLSQKTNITCVI